MLWLTGCTLHARPLHAEFLVEARGYWHPAMTFDMGRYTLVITKSGGAVLSLDNDRVYATGGGLVYHADGRSRVTYRHGWEGMDDGGGT